MGNKKILKIIVDEELYERLRREAVSQGYINVEDYVVAILKNMLYRGGVNYEEIIEKIKPRVKRIVEDSVNQALRELFELKSRVAELFSKIENLEAEVAKLKQAKTRPQPEKPARRRRKTGIEILHEQKVLMESKLAEKLRDRDRFFEYLRREGAVVLELEGERIAVDPEFWSQFVEKISSIDTPDPYEVRNYLSPLEYELFRKLRDSELVIYDSSRRGWRVTYG